MKNLLSAFLVFFSVLAHAQDMKPYAQKPTSGKFKDIAQVLKEDKTSEQPYIVGKFTCHNFAKTLYLQRSEFVNDLAPYNVEAILEDWGVEIKREAQTKKLPLYTVTIYNAESGFYHAINAVLINPALPATLDSFVFLEPQTDEIFSSPKEMYNHYAHYLKKTETGKVLEVEVGTFDEFKFNGYIYQSFDTKLVKGQLF